MMVVFILKVKAKKHRFGLIFFFIIFESKYITSSVTTRSRVPYNFHSIGRFIDELCVINDRNSFVENFKEIYPKELDLKLEHDGSHAIFQDLDIEIKVAIFVYNFLTKEMHSFEIVQMPFICSNIPSNIFNGAILSEIFCILLFIADERLFELILNYFIFSNQWISLVGISFAVDYTCHNTPEIVCKSEQLISQILPSLLMFLFVFTFLYIDVSSQMFYNVFVCLLYHLNITIMGKFIISYKFYNFWGFFMFLLQIPFYVIFNYIISLLYNNRFTL